MASSKPDSVLVWMANRRSYVESVPGTDLRIKNASKFGENLYGFKDLPGELCDLKWEALFKLRPTLVEIAFGRNPCDSFVEILEKNYENEKIREFFEKVKAMNLHMTDISAESLLKLLDKFTLLAAFSFSETSFSKPEWETILRRLSELNLRGIQISDNILEEVRRNLDIALVKLAGNPGVGVEEFKKGIEFVTVKVLAVQDLKFQEDNDAEQLLDVIPQSFPRLETLIWDWNVVDPELNYDDRTKNVLAQLLDVHEKLNLGALAIIAYTPNHETKSAIESVARTLKTRVKDVQLHQFATKGLSDGASNFSLIVGGQNEKVLKELVEMYVVDRSTMPPMGKLLRLCEEDFVPMYPSIVMDFGGFDKARIRQLYTTD
uniref:F-box domain-containing protein n=1 Tax=Caenorhabditis tropicalis TaxID=1561998 RepID=A0A1I7T6U9_9PELO